MKDATRMRGVKTINNIFLLGLVQFRFIYFFFDAVSVFRLPGCHIEYSATNSVVNDSVDRSEEEETIDEHESYMKGINIIIACL